MNQLDFIWAQDPDGYIGKNGTMPWHLPADLKHFKAVTLNHPVIMGANTFKSIGRPLPKRENIVLTHQKLDDAKITVVHSVEELKELLADRLVGQRCFVIGGAQIYQTQLAIFIEQWLNGTLAAIPKCRPLIIRDGVWQMWRK